MVGTLNDLNFRLQPQGEGKISRDLAGNLEDIKSYYTMESERIIHRRVTENGDENPRSVELTIQEEDDSVELF